jgi:hypothetical protein
MTPVSERDLAQFGAVDVDPAAQQAHLVAGHAVGVVARGWKLTEAYLGAVDWPSEDGSEDIRGGIECRSADADQPFITFAGAWAAAMWMCQCQDADFKDATHAALVDNTNGIAGRFETHVALLNGVAAQLGYSRVGRAWKVKWDDELSPLYPAMREIAELLIDGHSVTHEDVQAAVDRCRND